MILSSRPHQQWHVGKWPCIERATKEMAYDNGVIHRNNTEEALLLRVMTYICGKFTLSELAVVNQELALLDDYNFNELVCGEQGVVNVSVLTERVLREVFDAL